MSSTESIERTRMEINDAALSTKYRTKYQVDGQYYNYTYVLHIIQLFKANLQTCVN